jgi:phasin family protein
MSSVNEQFVDAARTSLADRLSVVSELSMNAIDSIQQVVDLNLNAAEASAKDSAVAARKMLAAKDPQEFLSLSAAQANPAAARAIEYNLHLAAIAAVTQAEIARVAEAKIDELLTARDPQEFLSLSVAQANPAAARATAYNLHLAAIAAATQAEIARATEAQIDETDRKVSTLIDAVSKSVPAGLEDVMAIMKCAIGNASAGYEHFSKTTRQAVEVMETNLNTAANRFSEVATSGRSSSG